MNTDTNTEFVANVTEALAAHDIAKDASAAPDVLMVRSPRAGGRGVMKASVPAAEVDNYLKAGWHKA